MAMYSSRAYSSVSHSGMAPNMEFWSLDSATPLDGPCHVPVQFVSLFQRRLQRRLWDSAGFKIVRA